MMDAIITKAELARELNLSRARISQLCQIGLPVRTDGKLNRAEALAWVKANHCPWRGGWWGDLRKKNKTTVRAGRRQRAPMPEASMVGGVDFELPQIEFGDLPEFDLKDLEIPDLEAETRNAAYRQLFDRVVRAAEVLPEVLLSL